MANSVLSQDRRLRVLTVGLAAAVCLYVLVVVVAEPLRSTAQATSDSEIILTIDDFLTLNCSGTLNLGSYSGGVLGDTGPFSQTGSLNCNVQTNDTDGYTLGWLVQAGSGGTNTGYMISQFEDTIAPFGTSSTVPTSWSVAAADSEWGGHLDVGAPAHDATLLDWASNTDPAALWMRVATGSTVTIGRKSSAAVVGGDNNRVGFRAEVGSSKTQPAGTYRATVRFTATNQ